MEKEISPGFLLTLIARLHRERMDIPFGEDKESCGWPGNWQGPRVEERMGFSSIILAERYAWAVDRDEGLQGCGRSCPASAGRRTAGPWPSP